MAVFERVVLSIKGENYTVESDRVMGLINQIENHITFFDLVNPQYLRNEQLSRAYHAALTYAGADVKIEDVYVSLFSVDGKEKVIDRINGLLSMMIPPKHLQASLDVKKYRPSPKALGLLSLLILPWLVVAVLLVKNFGL